MRQAAQGAGFQRIEILEEPVAAAVYHASRARDRVKDGEIFLVYDLGGGTFDATLVRRKGLRYELLGAPDGRQVGGEDFDNCIYADVLAKLPSAMREKFAQPHYRAARMQMLHICRDIKHALSISPEINKSLTLTGQVVNYHLSREQFVSMIEENIEETITCCEGLLKRAKIASRDVRCVLLVGGSCRIPYIRERLKQRLNIDVFPIDEPELAVSMGAAFYGDALDRATAFVQKVDGLGTSAQFRNMLYQHLPELFHMLAHPLAYGIAQEAVKPALRSWQQGWTTKLNDIQQGIEHRTKQWITSDTCKEAIRKISLTWVQQRIPEIARLSDPICDAYGVSRNILRLPTTIPALEAGLPGVPVNEGAMVNLNAISGLVTAIVAIVMGIIIVHLHLAGPVGIIAAAATYYFGRGKTEQWIREANLPQWFRKLVLSDDKIESQVSNAQSTLATALFTELEKNRVNFDQFVAEIQRILQETMHEQATREARFIWLHTNEEQAQAA
jgi:molecular chaperone DnaK (HSP70)